MKEKNESVIASELKKKQQELNVEDIAEQVANMDVPSAVLDLTDDEPINPNEAVDYAAKLRNMQNALRGNKAQVAHYDETADLNFDDEEDEVAPAKSKSKPKVKSEEPKQEVKQEVQIAESEEDEEEEIDFDKEEIYGDEYDKDDIMSDKYARKSYKDINTKTTGNMVLDAIKVDLNEITIVEKSALKQAEDMNAVFNIGKPTFNVVACQSGYSAGLSALSIADTNAINNSTMDVTQQRKTIYKTIYNKIENMSIPKPTFNDWLKITSFGDLDTLLFAIYCQTYPENNEFDITCGNCKKKTSILIDNEYLIEAKQKDVYSKIIEVTNSEYSGEELIQHSLVHSFDRVMLNDSKIVVDIYTPSLFDHLALLKSTPREILSEYGSLLGLMLFIKEIYMLDVKSTQLSGNPSYYPIKGKDRILNLLSKLSPSDGQQLEDVITKRSEKYQIKYAINNAKCHHCKNPIPTIPVDMETVLFTRINRKNKA